MAMAATADRSRLERMLDGVERLGNKVPNPALNLIVFIIIVARLVCLLLCGMCHEATQPME